VEELFHALCEGRSGVSTVESFDASQFTVHFGGEIKNFDVTKYIDRRDAKRMDRFSEFAVAGAIQAVKDSGLDFSREDPYRMGVIVGTGIGGIKEIEDQHIRLLEKGPTKVSPFCVPRLMANAGSGNIAIQFGLRGPSFTVSSACASSNHTIGEAFWNIASERSEVVVTGGSEAALTPIGLGSFCAARSLSTRNDNPQAASRPFDRDRDGFVLAEGAGILILEELEHARKRGAKVYAELLGYGATGDGYHITAPLPNGEGAAMAMKLALADAKINPADVDYINAHGTSTELNDIAERLRSRHFWRVVYRFHQLDQEPRGTHAGRDSGRGADCGDQDYQHSLIPPTINLENQDERCDLKMDYVPLKAREAKVDVALSNSFGFGGHNACLVVGRI
jgi:3-oxoacyl-[acyl-carrier-protein] synthase II